MNVVTNEKKQIKMEQEWCIGKISRRFYTEDFSHPSKLRSFNYNMGKGWI